MSENGHAPDEIYFKRDYTGCYMEEGFIRIDGDYVQNIFKCQVCYAITFDPASHENWHKNVLWQPET